MSVLVVTAPGFKTILNFYCCRWNKEQGFAPGFKTILNFYCCRSKEISDFIKFQNNIKFLLL